MTEIPTRRFTADLYALITVEFDAPTADHARKALTEDTAQGMFPERGPIRLINDEAPAVALWLTSLSHRKVRQIHQRNDDHTLTPMPDHPTDGPVEELEDGYGIPEFCAAPDCATPLDDTSSAYEGYCGTCADIREQRTRFC